MQSLCQLHLVVVVTPHEDEAVHPRDDGHPQSERRRGPQHDEAGRGGVDVRIDGLAHDERAGDGLGRDDKDEEERNEQLPPVGPRKLEQTHHERYFDLYRVPVCNVRAMVVVVQVGTAARQKQKRPGTFLPRPFGDAPEFSGGLARSRTPRFWGIKFPAIGG